MKRIPLIILCIALFAGCTTETEQSPPDALASVDTTTSAAPSLSITPAPVETLDATPACDGLGRPRPRGEITFVRDDHLVAVTPGGEHERCLADLSRSGVSVEPGYVAWNGPADRVIVGDRALSKDLAETIELAPATSGPPLWSRPNGTSVIYVTRDGRLMKRSSFGGAATDISFLARHDDVTYHPAGQHIATSGLAEDDSYGLYLATNVGAEEKLLARGEAARFIRDLEFSQDGLYLYYNARHGPKNWHLHRLRIGEDARLETLDKGDFASRYSVAPFQPDLYAWFSPGDCGAGVPGTLHVPRYFEDRLNIPDHLTEQNLEPVGWLLNAGLVVRAAPAGCSATLPGDVYILSKKAPVLIERDIGLSVGVRVKMPPPPPPPGEEQEVVA